MKLLETTAGALKAALNTIARAVEPVGTLPILGMVKFEGATVEACNLDLSISVVWLDGHVKPGFCVEYRPLARLLERLPAETAVSISDAEGARVDVAFGTSSYNLASAPAADFPVIERLGRAAAVPVDAKALRKALIGVRQFISTEETRYYLNGVCLDAAEAVATDGHRLGVHPLGFDASVFARGIIPRQAVDALIGLSKLCGMSLCTPEKGCATILAVGGDVTIRARLIDGNYPDWRRIVPTYGENGRTITVRRADLLRVVRRILDVVPGYLSSVYLVGSNGRLTLICHNEILDVMAVESIDLLSGETAPVCFKSLYLLDLLRQFSGEVVTANVDPGEAPYPSTWRDAGEAYVVLMPMKPKKETVAAVMRAHIREVPAAGTGGAA